MTNFTSLLMLVACLGSFVFSFYFIIRQMVLVDRVLKFVYNEHTDLWIKWGGPIGFFWKPSKPASSFFQACNARNTLAFDYLFGGKEEFPPFLRIYYRDFEHNRTKLFVSLGLFGTMLSVVFFLSRPM